MAYYNGSASSFAELQSHLVDALVDQGWILSSGILSKGSAFVRPYVSSTTTTTEGPGLLIQMGDGQSGAAIVNPAPNAARLGRPGSADRFEGVSFPAEYFIHVFDDPDEVYVILRFNIDRYFWLAFGSSSLNTAGTGNWLSGCARQGYITATGPTTGYLISPTSGGVGSANTASGASVSGGLFWNTQKMTLAGGLGEFVNAGLNSLSWNGTSNTGTNNAAERLHAVGFIAPLVERSPSPWNSEAVLLPIQPHVTVSESKVVMVADLQNARYLRIDNYEPGQIFSIGPESWKVYPFYLKNTVSRDGGSAVNHTGTFGMAIRYDGA